MKYRIAVEGDFLRADLYDRVTLDESRVFLRAVRARQGTFGGRRILMAVWRSAPLFRTNGHGSVLDDFRAIAPDDGYRIALLADSRPLRLSHEYLEGLARARGIGLRSFVNEAFARKWLQERRTGLERRGTGQDFHPQQASIYDAENRRRERRVLALVRGLC